MANVAIRYDAAKNVVYCRNSGFFSADDIAYFERELPIAVASARRVSPVVRVLFDNLDSVVQTADIAGRMAAVGGALERPGDRFAAVVKTQLVKMQADRLLKGDMKCFLTIEEAEAWFEE
jgi:hypothetical protein